MTNRIRHLLKSYFTQGAIPTEAQFAEFIDACLMFGDDGVGRSDLGELEIASSLRVKGDLLLDGTLWLANTQGIALRGIAPIASESGSASAASATSQARSALPSGAILLWSGEQLPSGYVKCNGNHNTPKLSAPSSLNGPELVYIIKV